MVCNLPHLHDKTEDVRVVIEHYAPRNICIELTRAIRHDASREVTLNFPKELIMDNDFLRRKLLLIVSPNHSHNCTPLCETYH